MSNKKNSEVALEYDNSTEKESKKTYFQKRQIHQWEAKVAVAKHVVEHHLKEGDSILLDAGTSSYPIAKGIAQRAQEAPQNTHFTIMTHNYQAFQILIKEVPTEANLNMFLAGGRYDRDLNALFGPQTIEAYKSFFPRVAIVAVSGMVAEQGLFCHGNTEELFVKEIIFSKSARDRIIITDYTKIGVQDAMRFGSSEKLRAMVDECVIVTDAPPKSESKAVREKFQSEIEHLKDYEVVIEIVKVVNKSDKS